jgi:iron complex outermembrane receptor protein
MQRRACACAVLALLCARAGAATQVAAKDLADLSLEELSNINVTSVSGKAEPLSGAPGSIFVITAEDIRRSAATSLPEALRLAPNLQVARVNAGNYAITARGSNSTLENKMLVLIDGRIVYSPLYSGVFWDAQDVMLEDVERIEVISGPGGTLWGSNAVNGVINIITRSAADTQGTLVTAGGGNTQSGASARYGGTTDGGGHYRIYAKYDDYQDTKTASGTSAADGLHRTQAGFRTDWSAGIDKFTLQGDAYTGTEQQLAASPIEIGGANLTGRWNRQFADGSQLQVLAYFDHTQRNQPGAYVEHLDTANIELQHTFKLNAANEVVWGGGYRVSADRVQNGPVIAFFPASVDLRWGNVFAQDDFALRDDLHLTAGAKVETNIYTGAEFLPSLRLAWKLAPNHLLWAAASRSVRAPSRIDRDLYSPSTPLAVVGGTPVYLLAGGPNFVSEVAKVYEIGYRGQPTAALSYSITGFVQNYDKLRTIEPGLLGLNYTLANKSSGAVAGVEMWGNWQVMPKWRLSAGYVGQHTRANLDSDSLAAGPITLGDDPSRYWTLRSSTDIADGKELDIAVRHVSALPTPAVAAYYAVDLRLGIRLAKSLQLALIAQNLFEPTHVEFGTAPGYSEIERGFFVKLTYKY